MEVLKRFSALIFFVLGLFGEKIFSSLYSFFYSSKLENICLYFVMLLPAIVDVVGFLVSVICFVFDPGYEINDSNYDDKTIEIYKKHHKARILLGRIMYNIKEDVLYADLNGFYSSNRIAEYEKICSKPALKEIVKILCEIAYEKECKKVAICCDKYAPELQSVYEFNKLLTKDGNVYYLQYKCLKNS
ncbi:hypothetical protein [Agathobacter sp.]